MKRGIFSIILLLGSILFLFSQKMVLAEGCATSTGRSFLKINEFSAYSSSDWVELFNPLDICVDLFGLSLHDTGQTAMRNYQHGAEIAPHGWYTTSTSSRLDSQADAITLMFDSTEIDSIFYSTSTFCGTNENFVCARKNDGVDADSGEDWAFSLTATPGEANIIQSPIVPGDPLPEEEDETPTSTFDTFAWSQIKINEIMVDPDSGEDEWVELYNTATTSIDLTGGILCDGKESDCEIGSSTSTIEAGGYVILIWGSSELNNSGDKVIWRNPDGAIIDEVQYGEGFLPIPSDGNSLARDPGDNWVITTASTPGTVNNIVAPIVPVVSSGGGGGSSVNSNINNDVEIKAKVVKTTTSTVKIKEDPVKVVWKIKPPTQGSPNESLLFDASGSADPRGGLLEVLWNFGDGTNGVGEKIEHSFATPGVYAVLVSATSTVGTIGSKKLSVRIASGLSTKNVGVKISEVMVNPVGADNKEFVKLYNASSSTVDLSGWKLIYKDKEYIFPEKTNIIATSSLVFYQAVTHFMLENSGGKVELLTPDDNIVGVVDYGKAVEGQSFTTASTTQVLGVKISSANNTVKSVAKKSTSKTSYIYGGQMSVAEARLAAKNTSVKIRGTVVVLPGVFGVQYFYITDGLVGMQIYQNKKLFPDLRVGDNIEVVGITSASGEIKRVNVKNKTDMRVLSSGISSSTLISIEDLDEEMLGGLIKIAGEITEIKSNFMYVDDGTTELAVYFKQGAKIDKKKFKEGDLVEVEGVLEKSKTGLQIWPRGQEDVRVTGQSEDLLSQTKSDNAGSDNMLKIYLMVTAGGVTVLVLGFLIKARWFV